MYVLNYARAFKSRWLVIENVVQMRNWSRYAELLEALRCDYKVVPQVLDASDFGVPQSRRRLFLLCDRKREPPDLSSRRVGRPAAAREILDPPGTWMTRPLRSPNRAIETLGRADRAIPEIGEGVPFLIVYYSTDGGGAGRRSTGRFGLSQRSIDSAWSNGRMASLPCECSRYRNSSWPWALMRATSC